MYLISSTMVEGTPFRDSLARGAGEGEHRTLNLCPASLGVLATAFLDAPAGVCTTCSLSCRRPALGLTPPSNPLT